MHFQLRLWSTFFGGKLTLPLSGLGEQLWRAAAREAGPGASISELARWVEGQTGISLTPGSRG
ncbi:MAG: hypothetical protein JHC40_21675 [Burkholderiales bacterium]|jgi:molybdopterin biosynthesis enzyme MoaB|nr:hypothetical protein [Burkholderiales bacterium]